MDNPFPKNHIFGNFVRTSTPDNIYYADLFQIDGRVWMIQGYGKTDAARIATSKNDDLMYGTDSIALIRQEDGLWGRYDLGAASDYNSQLTKLHKIDAIAYCLNETQTIQAFRPRDDKREIVEAGHEILTPLSATYPYPASLVSHFFPAQEAAYYANPARMTERFAELTKDITGTKFLLVPYMPVVEDKAALYNSFAFLP